MTDNSINFSIYKTYSQLYSDMKKLSEKYPNLSRLYSIGKTRKKSDLWLMEITNYDTGSAEDKPGIWVDGNTHGPEVTGSAVCLKTIGYLLYNYRKNEFVTDLLDTKSFYILPRVNVDGAEIWFTQHRHQPEAGIPNPDFEDAEGLYEEDVNGDGKIVKMRILDPDGTWKISKKDPRLMLKRQEEDTEKEGPFYRIMGEGMILKYKPGKEIKLAPLRFLGGTNRNYPAYWGPGLIIGSHWTGPFPLWEREPRAIADFWADHPNLCILHTFHTSGGIITRESATKPDSAFGDEGLDLDLEIYKKIGNIGEKITGYPSVSIFEDFTQRDTRPHRRGCSTSFFYEHLGAYSFLIELWDWAYLLGFGNFRERGGINFSYTKLSEEKQLKILEWIDKEMNGEGFINWESFNHPQLGPLDIGGLDIRFTRRNPPEGEWLDYEADKTLMFALKTAELLPQLRITRTSVTKIANQIFKVEAQIENTGFLPTNITEMAIKINVAKPVITQLQYDDKEIELVSGEEKNNIGQLDGRSAKILPPKRIGAESEDKTKKHVQWIIKTKTNNKVKIKIIARCPRAGKHTKEIILQS